MFKFDFDVSDDEAPVKQPEMTTKTKADTLPESSATGAARYRSYTLMEMVSKLPKSITFSKYQMPFLPTDQTLHRRELFDARFQVMDESNDSETDGDADDQPYIDGDTDLIPGTYEGGLKTWEGGLDLVQVCAELQDQMEGGVDGWIRGKRVLEAGCGTAAPTAYLLRRLISSDVPSPNTKTTIFHLQDYNLAVLQLVTLPNLILAVLPDSQLADAGSDLDLDDETLDAFFHRLEEHNIELKFSSGDWSGLAEDLENEKESYDMVLTAETIYRPDSVPSLLRLLRAAAQVSKEGSKVVREEGRESVSTNAIVRLNDGECLTLIAAKVIYFGVGGDLHAFAAKVTDVGGKLEEVKAWNAGVGRKVLQLRW